MSGRAVDVCVDVPRLELDRPFTYLLPDEVEQATGHLVSVPFHGRTVKGWVLGPAEQVPQRVARVRRVVSAVPMFAERDLTLYRSIAERYVVPLATVISRASPPRVASEEKGGGDDRRAAPVPVAPSRRVLSQYENGELLVDAKGSRTIALRPRPDHEIDVCVEAVEACLAARRDAVVVVPEADPLPATARAVLERFGGAAVSFVGGDDRIRYRSWLEIRRGRYRVVVGTRPAVFAPVRNLGLIWVNREAHPGHREERAPYHTTRDVAMARARLERATCVLSALSPSGEVAALVDDRSVALARLPRARERAVAPLVETTAPRAEDRSPRLAERLASVSSAFLMLSLRGSGVARSCRRCGEPARCAACFGTIVERAGRATCAVCGADGACASCGATSFAIERGGTERLQEWASRVARRPVERVDEGREATSPAGRLVVGTAAAVKDFGPIHVELVALLDPDRGRRRPQLGSAEQAVATWFEAAAWAGPRGGPGRVLVQTRDPADPAIQALVRWDPAVFHRAERRRRSEAGFPPGFPVFRVRGSQRLAEALAELDPVTLLRSSAGTQTVCLVVLRPDAVPSFGSRMRALAGEGIVERVEADPHL